MSTVAHHVNGQPYGYVTVESRRARTVGRILDGLEVVGYALEVLAVSALILAGCVLAVTT